MAVSSGVIWMFLMALFMTLLFPILLLIVLGVKKKISARPLGLGFAGRFGAHCRWARSVLYRRTF